jgi:hypothetical protein
MKLCKNQKEKIGVDLTHCNIYPEVENCVNNRGGKEGERRFFYKQ